MKKLYFRVLKSIALISLLSVGSSFANTPEIPNCWKVRPTEVEAHYVAEILNADHIPGGELIEFLEDARLATLGNSEIMLDPAGWNYKKNGKPFPSRVVVRFKLRLISTDPAQRERTKSIMDEDISDFFERYKKRFKIQLSCKERPGPTRPGLSGSN